MFVIPRLFPGMMKRIAMLWIVESSILEPVDCTPTGSSMMKRCLFGGFRHLLGMSLSGFDSDLPTGQFGRQTRILSFLADG